MDKFFIILECRLLQVDETILDATETLTKLRALFDNYEMDAAVNEHVSPIERKEENEFLNAVLATPVMRLAMKFLQEKGKSSCGIRPHSAIFNIKQNKGHWYRRNF